MLATVSNGPFHPGAKSMFRLGAVALFTAFMAQAAPIAAETPLTAFSATIADVGQDASSPCSPRRSAPGWKWT